LLSIIRLWITDQNGPQSLCPNPILNQMNNIMKMLVEAMSSTSLKLINKEE